MHVVKNIYLPILKLWKAFMNDKRAINISDSTLTFLNYRLIHFWSFRYASFNFWLLRTIRCPLKGMTKALKLKQHLQVNQLTKLFSRTLSKCNYRIIERLNISYWRGRIISYEKIFCLTSLGRSSSSFESKRSQIRLGEVFYRS